MAAIRELDPMSAGDTVELMVGGMTCASCAARVQRRLNKLPGVDAAVNYATERATVRLVGHDGEPTTDAYAGGARDGARANATTAGGAGGAGGATAGGTLTIADLVQAVEAAGYTAAPLTPAGTRGQTDGPGSGGYPGRAQDSHPQSGHDHGSGFDAANPPTVDAIAEAETREAAETRRSWTRLWVSASLAVPVIVLAMVPPAQFPGWQWVSLGLAAPVVGWGGLPFHRATWRNARHGAVTMDTLISLGTLAAFGWSLYALVFGDAGMIGMRHGFDLAVGWTGGGPGESLDTIYFEVAAGVTVFLLVGRYLELRSRRRAGAALRALLEHGARDVAVVGPDGAERRVAVETLAVGDLFVARPGERIATDGVVAEGSAAIDTSLVTGESVPVDVGPGAAVTGGTVAGGGRLVVRATRVGADTQLAQMARMLAAAQSGKAEIARLADRVSAVFVPVVLVLAVATVATWLAIGQPVAAAFTAAVAVLIVACPCALGLATPMALLVGTGRGAQLGILIRGPEVLESTRRAQVVVLDKTGTVTTGRMSVVEVRPAPGSAAAGITAGEVLRLAGAVEAASEHPIAQAIAAAAGVAEAAGSAGTAGVASSGSALAAPAVTDFVALPGLGAGGTVDGCRVLVGRARLLAERGVPVDEDLAAWQVTTEAAGRTVVLVAWGPAPDRPPRLGDAGAGGAGTAGAAGAVGLCARGAVVVADTVRPSAADAVAALCGLGLRPMLVTGDAEPVARAVAAQVGIDAADVVAGVLPAGKVETVRGLQAQGLVVAMVGDGVNDAPALAQADLGLAMGTGSDVAIEAGDLVLVGGDPTSAADAIRLSRATLRTIRGNLFWAFAYNVAALPVAALGLLNPMIAGAAMAASSLFVVSNSLRLRRFARHPADSA
ncbi:MULTISPECIES: cation-translocating P-type ATPase [unclassified Pseudofrankia]|uniref:heavy metal translocating P-type ATPase n=1 Tax=unclassified Pseudofrankia TaxID=2994372 RepID=UPI0008DA228E|nr:MULTISPECIES: heavy metal translocating P-type ATPase [unclassified Pseudofrankia]MDT3438644.1 heavy metal translocating P-type ATPase [Pseudofrankia sp. BMG5.37]OHV49261.1 carbonate dehydratase [Pseudofrankia sp. BMG5.36]